MKATRPPARRLYTQARIASLLGIPTAHVSEDDIWEYKAWQLEAGAHCRCARGDGWAGYVRTDGSLVVTRRWPGAGGVE